MQNDYLERNLADVEKRYESEVARYQDRISKITGDLDNASNEMKKHLAEYKRLMSVKQSLEREIETYRQLLEGEGGKMRYSCSDCNVMSLFITISTLDEQLRVAVTIVMTTR